MPNRCGKFKPVWKDMNILKLKEIFLINFVSWWWDFKFGVYCCLFVFISLAVIQEIYIEMVFCKESISVPISLSLESWHLLKVARVFISFMFKSVNLSILQKTLTKLANLLMHSQCALSEPISSSRKTRKWTVCRFI